MSLPRNEHLADRIVRVIVGIALVGLLLAGSPAAPLSYLVGVIATLAVVTGLVGFCPLYALLRVSTRSVARR